MFSSLKVKNFRIYWSGTVISLIGSWIQITAQSWLVFQLTNSVFLLGVVGFLNSLPVFLLSLFGGLLADRHQKRIILITTQTVFMLLAFLLAALTQLNLITPGQIMFIAFLNGIAMAFDGPSRQAMVVELVGKENLFNAITLNLVAFNSSRIIGPAVAGIMVATIGMSGCFYVNAISFLPLIAALFVIRVNSSARSRKNGHALEELKEGLIFVKNNRLILILVSMVAVASLFGITYVIFMPVFANDILKVGVKGLGILMSSAGVGALIGALLLARLGDFKYKGRLLIWSSFIFSFSLMFFALSKTYLLSILALALIGFSNIVSIAIINTFLQTKVADEFRGRVMGVFMFTFFGILPFGNLIAGALAHFFGVSFTILINGIICALFFTAINLVYPKIRAIS
ncbi:MAG: MFS transporter [Candidatus Omnitrophica bacterium]|nr:MFS transporter [Candidatus Omnitrophota bacterium]